MVTGIRSVYVRMNWNAAVNYGMNIPDLFSILFQLLQN